MTVIDHTVVKPTKVEALAEWLPTRGTAEVRVHRCW